MVRFFAPPNDTTNSIINCAGQSNSGSGSTTVWYSNAFLVGTVSSTSWLQCQVRTSGAGAVLTINLIPNVTNLTVLYGVASSAAGDDYSVIQYLTAGQMSAATWPNVTAVKVTLTFLVPQYGSTGGQMTHQHPDLSARDSRHEPRRGGHMSARHLRMHRPPAWHRADFQSAVAAGHHDSCPGHVPQHGIGGEDLGQRARESSAPCMRP